MVGVSLMIFGMTLVFWLFASLLINTMNTSLTIKIQSMNDEIEMLRSENQTMSYEIQTLESKDRIYALAQAADLSQLNDNIISIQGD